MPSLPLSAIPKPAQNRNGAWEYWRQPDSGVVELGTVRGCDVALPPHFHDEDQLTFVMSGRRRFVIGDEVVALSPGQGARIPAGKPHRSLSEPSDVVCLNLYLPPGAHAAHDLMVSLARHWRGAGRLDWRDLAAIVEDHQCVAARSLRPTPERPMTERLGDECWESVRQAAQRVGLSREGYTRRFKRDCGLPPHAFWLLEKLNDARRRLRAGDSIAGVAAETGFADQSHLGRCFRRAFGVTPGRYRAG
jgi:AraC-like DNA-binding protein